MEILIFDLRGPLAHFRRPDTTNTHATYPFISYTTVRGLAGSIIGLPDFKGKARVGIRLMSPVRTSVQQMSMLGKGWLGGGNDVNRPVAIELLVAPHYRIYWTGDYLTELKNLISSNCSHYHTYLGSAFALTFPQYIGTYNCSALYQSKQPVNCSSVIPITAVEKVIPTPETQYGRVGGMHCDYHGDRKFGSTTSVLYEPTGNIIKFIPKENENTESHILAKLEQGEIVCLW
ncbi:MAG: CRISPR-associated protein Cas5 [Dethiobacteria bacterium]|jgi:CRISPR-associated protein Cas5h